MQYGSTIGAKLIFCSLVALLYGLICAQCYGYYQRAHQERFQSKVVSLSVFLLWLLSTLHFIFSEMDMYLSLISVVDSGKILNKTFWEVTAVDVLTLVTTLFAQCWYCHRMWVLSDKNKLLTYPLLGIIVMWFGFGTASCVEIVVSKNLAQYRSVLWLSLTSVSLTTLADFYIAMSLVYILYQQRKGIRQRTSSLLNIIIIYTVATGLITSVVSVSYLIANLTLPNTWIWVGEYMLFCGLHCNSLLFWINARRQLRQDIEQPMGRGTISAIVAQGLQPSIPLFVSHPPRPTSILGHEHDIERVESDSSGGDAHHLNSEKTSDGTSYAV